MADGKSHGSITIGVATIITPITLIITHSLYQTLLLGIGCLLGLFIEPDLDINHVTESEKRVIDKLWIFGYLWVALWIPYALIIPHRSFISHTPFVGTIIRVLYLSIWAWAVCLSLDIGNWVLNLLGSNLGLLWWLILGLSISDIGHWIADWNIWRNKW